MYATREANEEIYYIFLTGAMCLFVCECIYVQYSQIANNRKIYIMRKISWIYFKVQTYT